MKLCQPTGVSCNIGEFIKQDLECIVMPRQVFSCVRAALSARMWETLSRALPVQSTHYFTLHAGLSFLTSVQLCGQ